ncbi:hypothetical protein T069G_00965 [Trichoderma breve]|uniref:DnaJ homologue subfamily C member 28 conserved domain-containing protein n=1 Tax=Trichoderma breve TaxID=2034170 RepID=A0A9W9JRA8_9HYPO|nr:hypothetical protein T069G_00965 [Trichoderma breve]KAJ4864435.1 hypothetical protein T069G_00965 [Trichoderma breve]
MIPRVSSSLCQKCLQASARFGPQGARRYTSPANQLTGDESKTDQENTSKPDNDGSSQESEPGAMTRRLQEATEEALFSGGSSGRRAVQDAGFSDELKEKLLNKIADANFRQEFSSAFAEKDLTSAAGEGTRHIATSAPWTGDESTADAVLRMLDDAKKPLKPEFRGKFQPPVVDPRVKRTPVVPPRQRAVNARDRASMYAGLGLKEDKGLSDKEREEMRKEFRARFEPVARVMPSTPSGLAALANDHIENAIARGQFKNIARGKGVEIDLTRSNPFVDTTEYLMNRIIQRQDIVPPWIEKQQELSKAADALRSRLRADWKRHAARMIASKGGSLEEQMSRADQYAVAEKLHNPRQSTEKSVNTTEQEPGQSSEPDIVPISRPFRDPDWERAEHAYLKLSIEQLNGIARSYNLMAPELAKKPYYNLQRELDACFADVAPLIAKEIKDRATRPRVTSNLTSKPSPFGGDGIMSNLVGKDTVKIYDTRAQPYGFKEWWKDVWKKE